MNKPITLCDRCDVAGRCLLNYDGNPCRKNRTVEPTNYDRIVSKSPEELAEFLRPLTDCTRCYAWNHDPPWDMRPCYTGEKPCEQMWLDWLKKEVMK